MKIQNNTKRLNLQFKSSAINWCLSYLFQIFQKFFIVKMNTHLRSHNTTLFLFVNGPDTNRVFDIRVNVLPGLIVFIQFSWYSYILNNKHIKIKM